MLSVSSVVLIKHLGPRMQIHKHVKRWKQAREFVFPLYDGEKAER